MINKISALGRPIDLSYPTNRILVIVVLLAMAVTLHFSPLGEQQFTA